jgi:hypothetical protein
VLADRLRKTTADLSGALRGEPRPTDPGDHLFHE